MAGHPGPTTGVSLQAHIAARIAAQGPISIAEFMAECLLHPTLGYYTKQEPFGAGGDFTTAPEISQMFGELIGLCLAQAWLDQGRPDPFTLAELGPGRGTLMADMLRATAGIDGFSSAARPVLIEASPRLREIQRATLSAHDISFASEVQDLPPAPLFFVANEFFDALPIRQFQRGETSWRERQIGLSNGALCIGLAPQSPQPALAHRLEDTDIDDVVEYAPAAAPIMSGLTTCIAAHGGAGLVIDYGDWRSLGDTLQAMKSHAFVSVLESPGESDLTAHVDFEALAQATETGCRHTRLTPQGVFLERLGITPRAQALATGLTGEALATHLRAHRRLTHPEEMGNLFKLMGFYPEKSPPPAGLDA